LVIFESERFDSKLFAKNLSLGPRGGPDPGLSAGVWLLKKKPDPAFGGVSPPEGGGGGPRPRGRSLGFFLNPGPLFLLEKGV